MKRIKLRIIVCLTFSLMIGKMSGQNVNSETSEALPVPDSLTVESADTLINVAFKTVDPEDKFGGASVLNVNEISNYYYSSSIYDGLDGQIGGMIGTGNIWGLNNVLVMIDGVPRNLSDIRLDEVEQLTVLKSASASVLYGSHAAGGVILITTKRGIAEGRKINVRLNQGMAIPKLYPDFLPAADYMTLYNEARANDGQDALYDEETIENYRSGNPYRFPDLDYYAGEYLNDHINMTNLDADFSAGNEVARFYANIGWFSNSSLINFGQGENEMDNRFNARGNVDLKINNFISSTIDVSSVISNSRRGLGNYWYSAATIQPNKFSPLIPMDRIHPDSSSVLLLAENSTNIIEDGYILGGSQEYLTNPIADMLVGGYNTYVHRILQITNGINVDLNNLVKGLSFHTLLNADYYSFFNQSINNEYAVYAPQWDTLAGEEVITTLTKYGNDSRTGTQNISGTGQTRNLGFSMYFQYARSFEDVHNISGMLLGKANSRSYNGVYQPETYANLGIQLGYNFDHRYWIDFSGAFLNSTKLPENNRTAFSPTLAVSWLLSEEAFLAGSNAVDLLKLTLSGGILNTDITIADFYLYDNTYAPDRWFSWHDDLYRNRSTTSSQGANPDFTFSRREEITASLEGSLFDRLISFEASWFLTQIDGLPTQRFSQYPSYYSDFVPYTNYNANQYTGVDFMLNLNKSLGDLQLNLGVNGIYVTSKASKRDELYTNDYQLREGKPVDAIFGLESDGLFVDQADIESHPNQVFGEVQPGDIKYVDQNDDGRIDVNDEIQIGKWGSPFYAALNLSVSYKGFTLFVQGMAGLGGDGVSANDYYWVDGDDKYSAVVLDRWTEETKNTATYPRLSSQSNSNNFRYSDFWIYETDRFDISRVQVSYDLPSDLLSKMTIKRLGIYINGSNLLRFSPNKEMLDLNVYGGPHLRYFNAGIRASF